MRNLFGFLGFVIGAALAAAIGGWATQQGMDGWYQGLAKPGWTPPELVFRLAWAVLYTLMAVAGWRIWRRRAADRPLRHTALALWWAQLVLNALWPVIFFWMQMPGAALAELSVLWALIVAAQVLFFLVDRTAALLWVPYVLWITFALLLNTAVVRLN